MLEYLQSRCEPNGGATLRLAVVPPVVAPTPPAGKGVRRLAPGEAARQAVGVERRLTRRLLSDWERLCGGAAAPRVQDFVRGRGEWFDEHAFLLKADEDPELSVFILYGSRLRAHFGCRLTGMTVCEAAPAWLRIPLQQACEDCCGDGMPREIEGAAGAAAARFRAIILPLSGARHPIGYLLGTLTLDRPEG